MPSSVRLLNVQVLRAYGAFAVAFYHTDFVFNIGLGRPIGSFGVGIFFVISGFMMAVICDTDPRHFLARRIARIVPLYWLLTMALFLFGTVAPGLLGGTSVDAVYLVKSLFFIPYLNHGTYFPILFLGWSLNYEMYFYILIAMALAISKRNALLLASGWMIAILLILQIWRPKNALMFYGHPIILLFVIGILCYFIYRAVPGERILKNQGLLVGSGVAATLVMLVAAITLIGPPNALIVGFTSSVLVLSAVLLDKVGASIRWKFLILLGDASYVMYLIHPYCEQPLNKIAARVFPLLNTKTLVGMPVGLGITIVASIVLYRWLDNPLHIFFRKLLSRSPKLPSVSPATQPASD